MGPTYKIAEMLKISPIEATAYCEGVRSLTGLGSALQYKTIAQNLAQHLAEAPSPQSLAEIIGVNISVPGPIQQMKLSKAKSKKDKPKKNRGTARQKNISRAVKSGAWLQVEDLSKSIPYQNRLERKSPLDRDRVNEEKLDHCAHGVPRLRVCAICEPKKFREMTGID